MKSILSVLLLISFIFSGLLSYAREALNPIDVVPEIVNAGISVSVNKLSDPRLKKLNNAEDQYYLDIQLGRLTQTQYDLLISMYGRKSQVGYKADRDYNLIDFLPSSMQAVANQIYRPLHHSFNFLNESQYRALRDDVEGDHAMNIQSLIKNGISNESNCWSTVIQNLNYIHFADRNSEARKYELSLPGRWQADELLKSADTSTEVSMNAVRIYDALLVSEKSVMSDTAMLMHAAIHIGQKIVFEKTDSSANDPYRIALTADVVGKYRRIFEDGLVTENRRYGKKILVASEAVEMDPVLSRIIARASSDINQQSISYGCEAGFGGGCDLYMYEVKRTEVGVNPRNGRGILNAPQSVLRRFESLQAQ